MKTRYAVASAMVAGVLLGGLSDMSRFLLNIAKRSLLRLMLGGIGLASKNAA